MQTTACRRAARVGGAVFALIVVAWQPAAAQEPIEFKAGISDPVNTVLAWYVARDAGFYAAQGLKVDIVNMSGGSRGAAELQAGRLDVMHVGLSSVIRVNRGGGDLRSVGSLSNVIRFTFFSAPGVKTAADLRGGVIGVSTFGSESDSTVTLALARLGLTRSDVTLKEYGGGTRRLEAVKAGEIKATPINEPIASLARAQGVNVLIDLVPEQIPWVFSSIVVRRDDIAGRRDVLTRKTIEAARAREVIVAAAGATSNTAIVPKALNALIGTKFKVVAGYDTGAGLTLSIERGEAEGICGLSWSTIKASRPHWIRDKLLNIIVQMGLQKLSDLPDVPSALDLVTDPENRPVLELILIRQEAGRPFAAPPGVPADRIAALRRAFAATLDDGEFRADADKAQLEIEPLTASEIETFLARAYGAPRTTVQKAAALVEPSARAP